MPLASFNDSATAPCRSDARQPDMLTGFAASVCSQGRGLDLAAVGPAAFPRLGESRVDVICLDHDLRPHTAGAGEMSGTEMMLRGQSAAALESNAPPPRAHRHVPPRI